MATVILYENPNDHEEAVFKTKLERGVFEGFQLLDRSDFLKGRLRVGDVDYVIMHHSIKTDEVASLKELFPKVKFVGCSSWICAPPSLEENPFDRKIEFSCMCEDPGYDLLIPDYDIKCIEWLAKHG